MQHRVLMVGFTALALSLTATAQQSGTAEQRDDAAIAAAQAQQSAPAETSSTSTESATLPAAKPQEETTAPKAESAEPQLLERPQAIAAVLLPTGTAIHITLNQAISTKTIAPGSNFAATVKEDVRIDGRTIIAAGSVINGRIAHFAEPRRINGHPWIQLRPESATLADGRTVTISAIVVDTANPKRYDVSDEGRIQGPTVTKGDKIGAIATSGSGAIAGTIIGGAEGGLIGVGAAATYVTGRWLLKHNSLILPQGMGLILEISSPVMEPQEKIVAESVQ